jgi:hypothetical protein
MAMDERVIEAADQAYWENMRDFDRDKFAMRAAVTAALRAMEPELRAAVERLEDAVVVRYVNSLKGFNENTDYWNDEVDTARRDLFARLGLDGDA